MADSVVSCFDAPIVDQSETRNENDLTRVTDPPVKVRAKTARELVTNQERLVEMLQNMRSDLSKMEREANRIKEDVVRSNQLCHIVVKMGQAHHLPYSFDGYNMLYATPKITYPTVRHRLMEVNMKYLQQLSTYRPSASSSRRSSDSSWISRSRSTTTRGSSRRSTSTLTTDDNYSGTESEYETTSSRYWSPGSARSTSNLSQDSSEVAGSSTESLNTIGLRYDRSRRKPSYCFTTTNVSPPPEPSDDIDL